MSSTLTLLTATANDADCLLALIDALADYEKLDRPAGPARQRLIAHLLGDAPKASVILARLESTVIGYAVFFETYSTFLARPSLYLEDLFVLPEHRGLGAGTALFDHCLNQAKARQCGRMEWSVLTWNEPAIAFYEERYQATRLADWYAYRLTLEDIA